MPTLRFLTLFLALALGVRADTVAELAQSHVEAIGGAERVAEIKALKARGYTRIEDKTLEVLIIAQAPNRVRTEVTSGGQKSISAYDGEHLPWQCVAAGEQSKAVPMTERAAMEFIADSEFFDPLVTQGRRDFTLRSLGTADWEGTRYHVVVAMRTGCEPLELWVDPNTFLIDRQIRTRKTAGGFDIRLETRFSDFRLVRDVLMPFRITVYAGGKRLHETVIQSIEANPEVTEKSFREP